MGRPNLNKKCVACQSAAKGAARAGQGGGPGMNWAQWGDYCGPCCEEWAADQAARVLIALEPHEARVILEAHGLIPPVALTEDGLKSALRGQPELAYRVADDAGCFRIERVTVDDKDAWALLETL